MTRGRESDDVEPDADGTGVDDAAPADAVPGDDVPADTVPADTVPADTVPADTVPADTVPADAGSPMDIFDGQDAPRRWPRVLAAGAAVIVVLGGLYVGALWLWSDRVPPGTTVAGVEIGGLSAQDATERLEESLATASTEPIAVATQDKRTTLDPVAAGLELDAPATVESVTGFDLHPLRLWQQVFGGPPVEPVSRVDDEALAAAVENLEGSLTTEPVDGSIVFVDGQAVSTAAEDGIGVDTDATRELLVEQWLTAARPIALPTVVLEPLISTAEVDRVVAEIARPLAGAPVTVTVDDQRAELPAEAVTAAASFVPEGERLELVMDGEALVEAVLSRTTDLLTDAANARFEFQEGVPVIVPGVPGTTLDPEEVASAVATAGTGEDRTARVELVEVDPERSTAELEDLGVVEKISEFSTALTADSDRNHNLTLGASRVNGSLLRPGEVFSLTDALSPITTDGGYRQAGVVVNGVLTQGTGGGLSQMGTTVYNAGFFAGLEDVEHRPHSFYFSRYPAGREATIYDGVLDVKIGNNTPYGVLLQSWVAGGRLYVAVWSTEYWTVEEWTSARSNVVAPTTVYNTSAGCISQSAGSPGFSVTVGRRLIRDGEVQHEETNSWRYQPQDAIVCGPPPGTQDSAEE